MNKEVKDALGNRIKENYENRTRYSLPRRTYTILRLDGKSFHTYTKNLRKPFDVGLIHDMDNAIKEMVADIQGVVFAYTQSDEISVLLTDFATNQTDAWFDGNLQKMCSVSASIMTAEFNKQRISRQFVEKNQWYDPTLAYFDCRVFTIPDRIEVMNYFRWRQQDCIRNSVSMVAQSKFSHRELQGKSQSDMHEMFHQIGVNWATDYTDGEKNGRIIVKEQYTTSHPAINRSFGSVKQVISDVVVRTKWVSKDAWVFTKDEGKLLNMIPTTSNDAYNKTA